MSTDLPTIRSIDASSRRPWHGSAFIMESLLLLAFLVASLAVVISLMSSAYSRSDTADHLSRAVILASNDAEKFAANPTLPTLPTQYVLAGEELVEERGDDTEDLEAVYQLERDVTSYAQEAGVMYEAHIQVAYEGETLYELDTSRYVSAEGVAK